MGGDLVVTDGTHPSPQDCQVVVAFHTDNIPAGKVYGSFRDLTLARFTTLLFPANQLKGSINLAKSTENKDFQG